MKFISLSDTDLDFRSSAADSGFFASLPLLGSLLIWSLATAFPAEFSWKSTSELTLGFWG